MFFLLVYLLLLLPLEIWHRILYSLNPFLLKIEWEQCRVPEWGGRLR